MVNSNSEGAFPVHHATIARRLSLNVAKRRKSLRITQSQLAEQISVEPVTISRLERGKHLPSIATLEKIAQALMVSIAELLAENTTGAQASDEAIVVTAWLAALSDQDRQFALKSLKQLCDYLGRQHSQGH